MTRKAEMSFNLIIAGIIAIFLLILIVALVTGRLGNIFNAFKTVEKTDIGTAQSVCSSLCNELKAKVEASGTSIWKESEYCSKKFKIDLNGNGKIETTPATANEVLSCHDEKVNVMCNYDFVSDDGIVTTYSGSLC